MLIVVVVPQQMLQRDHHQALAISPRWLCLIAKRCDR
jgi:hypothetical protein